MNWIDELEKTIAENELEEPIARLPVECIVSFTDVKRLIKAVKISLDAFDRIDLIEPYSGSELGERFADIKDIAYDAFEYIKEVGNKQ